MTEHVGQVLDALMSQAGLTDYALEQRTGQVRRPAVSRSYIGKIRRGEANPSVEVLERLARGLGVDTRAFFEPTRLANANGEEAELGGANA